MRLTVTLRTQMKVIYRFTWIDDQGNNQPGRATFSEK